jgi:hypothetical protein
MTMEAIRNAWIPTGLATGLLLALLASSPATAGNRFWIGGGVSLGTGTVDYLSIEPVVGVRVTPRVSVGGSLIYRYRKDDRFTPDLSTTDYGASLFARYRLLGPTFLQAEYEHLSYEYRLDGSMRRDDFNSVLGGAGFVTPIAGRASFFALALYNFSYDRDEFPNPYSDSWIYRAGVTFGF